MKLKFHTRDASAIVEGIYKLSLPLLSSAADIRHLSLELTTNSQLVLGSRILEFHSCDQPKTFMSASLKQLDTE